VIAPRSAAPSRVSASLYAGTVTGAFLCGAAQAQTGGEPIVLPTISVQGQVAPDPGYQPERASSPKFTAPLLDTPRSVSVVPKQVIQDTASATLVEALRTVPGITFGAGEGGNPLGDRPFLRGYDTQASTFVDGVRDIGAQSRDVFNIDSVEIVKGPAGTIGGRGSAGGSINLVSKQPTVERFVAGTATLGNADYKRGTLDVNQQLSDTAAVRLNAMVHDQGVAGRDEVHQHRWGVAPTVALGLGTPTRASIGFYHVESDDLPDPGLPYNNPTFNARTDGRKRILFPGNGSAVDVDRSTFYGLTDRDFRRDKADIGTLRIEHDLADDITLRNTTRYAKTRQDYIWTQPDDSQGNLYYGLIWRRANTRVSDVESFVNQTDLFGKFVTGTIKHSFAAGLEYARETGENDTYTVATGSNRCPAGAGAAGGYNCTTLDAPNPSDPWTGSIFRTNNPTNAHTTTKAFYAFDTVELTRQWQVNFGVRVDDYAASFKTAIVDGVRTQFRRDDTLVNWQAGIVYKPLDNASVYFSYGTSSTPTGSALAQGSDPQSLTTAANQALAPEENRSFELGAKWDVLGERLSLTSAIFRTETTNARITLADGTVAMAGDKQVDGVELGAAGKVTDAWQVFAGYTYLKAILVKNGGAGTAFGLQDGARFPNTPRHSVSLWSTYQLLPDVTIGGGAFYTAKVYGSQPNNKWAPSYWRFDAMAAYKINAKLDLQLNVQNLTDKFYFNQAYPAHYLSVAPGRTATISLNAKF
jgi:catecholate siderophore receptor